MNVHARPGTIISVGVDSGQVRHADRGRRAFGKFATLFALTRCAPPIVGVVYLTEVEVAALKLLQPFPEQDEAETLQVTPAQEESFATVAVSVTDCEIVSPFSTGVTATLIWACGCGVAPGNPVH